LPFYPDQALQIRRGIQKSNKKPTFSRYILITTHELCGFLTFPSLHKPIKSTLSLVGVTVAGHLDRERFEYGMVQINEFY
jgi:hypothetical protein